MENENVVGYIDNLVSFGIIAPKRKSVIITNQRLLILDANSTSSAAASVGFSYLFGAFGRGAANRIAKDDVLDKTKALSQEDLDTALKSNSENVAIDNSNIDSIRISRKNIEIKAQGKTFKYGLANPDAKKKGKGVYEGYIQTLQNIFGSKVIAE
ncbi:putative DNA-binding protein [Candidatus Mancarchaeum acidiphilum]|uniref:Putative DNA-binding protein n=1 Tax=Candidatus Mancarchaeum acidiphilum TaxID=1920749 RepID=A0A218NMD7_9ARCH|nr:hypothetical protein [Candidatus Mancarchaeum acidiphilum]ASI13624.1 putative DNA-binding protein [Candidatus Mancarchaeum acidiphilum]